MIVIPLPDRKNCILENMLVSFHYCLKLLCYSVRYAYRAILLLIYEESDFKLVKTKRTILEKKSVEMNLFNSLLHN